MTQKIVNEFVNIHSLNDMSLPIVLSPTQPKSECLKEDLWLVCDKYKDYIYELLYQYGAVLFRGWPLVCAKDFKRTIGSLVPSLSSYTGGDSPRNKVLSNIYVSTNFPPSYDIPLHNEKSFSNSSPTLAFFFCEKAPLAGGETPIADGRKIYRSLSNELLEKFASKKIKYIMNLHDGFGVGKSWQECFETSSKKDVEFFLNGINAQFFWKNNGGLRVEEVINPVVRHPITNETVFFAQVDQWEPSYIAQNTNCSMDVLDEDLSYHSCVYGDNSKILHQDIDTILDAVKHHTVSFKWQEGDLLIADNILTLHGRYSYSGDRKILVAFSDFLFRENSTSNNIK